jgi:hypothetical protein
MRIKSLMSAASALAAIRRFSVGQTSATAQLESEWRAA